MHRQHKQKGYVLLVTIVIISVLSITSLAMMMIVFRYTGTIKSRKSGLFKYVKDDGSGEDENNSSDDSITHYIFDT